MRVSTRDDAREYAGSRVSTRDDRRLGSVVDNPVPNEVITMVETGSSDFQEAIENVEALPYDEQVLLIEIIRRRVIERQRADLIAEVAEARETYRVGDVRRGAVEDLLDELDCGDAGRCA